MPDTDQQARTENSFSADALTCIRNDVMLLDGIEFRLDGGEILQVQGPNGSGKTSLLRILCGLVSPESGEVFWNGKNIHVNRQDFFLAMSYIGHVNGIKLELTAQENLALSVALSVAVQGISLSNILERIGLAGYEDTLAGRLSSGQRRRLALARLLINGSSLWILDEPLTSLDDYGKQLMRDMITAHAAAGGITVLATHDPIDIRQHTVRVMNL